MYIWNICMVPSNAFIFSENIWALMDPAVLVQILFWRKIFGESKSLLPGNDCGYPAMKLPIGL